ncbi:MAG TPA: GAF domain-containing SpoIIE family protein phosphatase [Blastocatellia bacterium]|nr:GAF domain-containing SpoIIE family protein phosphatase [Blastocatellia bacterium]
MFPNGHTNDTAAPAAQSAQRLQSLVNELSVEFISILDLDELIDRVAHRIREVIDYKFFNLFLVDETRGGLAWKKAVGYNPEDVAAHEVIPFDRSIASAAWREGRTINIGDVSRDSRYLPIATEGGSLPLSEIAVPLSLARENKIVGVLTIESSEPNYFNRDHERILNVLGSHLAIALEHARVYDELRRRTREMRTLIEIGHEITSILDLDRLLNQIAALLDRIINYEFLLVGLIDETREEFVWHVEEGYGAQKRERANRTKVSYGVVGRAVRERRTQIVGDVLRDPDYYLTDKWEGQGQRSEIAVPLIYEENVIGALALESSRTNAFDENHGRLLENIANTLSIAIANARLYAEHVQRERQLEREILMARDVQRAMIPDAPPSMKGFEIAARLEPALNLSGDFYDYIPLTPDRMGILIGDVAGKGVRAAMGMAAARSILRSVARRGGGPSRALRDANLRLHRDLGRELLLTLVYAILDTETKTINYCNAGHNSPLLVKASGKWRALKTGGLLLGVFDKQQYKSETLHLEKGDVLFFYTDGLTEAHTPQPHRVEFGEKRIIDFLLEHRHLRASAIIEAFLDHIKEFTIGAHQHDDLTLVVVKAL